MDDERAGDDPELQRFYDELAREADADIGKETLPPYIEDPPPSGYRRWDWKQGNTNRIRFLEGLRGGLTVKEALAEIKIAYNTYLSWRSRYPDFAAKADEARMIVEASRKNGPGWSGSPAQFHSHFFGHKPTWFQLRAIYEMDQMPRGNILMVLWFPESGKTTTFEDHANRKLAEVPETRFLCCSESQPIAKKILGRVMTRMSPLGPCPAYVDQFGPFQPQPGSQGRDAQPWSTVRFNVYKARFADERDYSMLAVGAGSKNIVSTRTDHAHLDDIQSLKTLAQTPALVEWFRQDLLSRPGEDGITSIFGTRVGEADFYEQLLEDDNLDASIMKVIRYPAIITDNQTGTVSSLYPEKWPLEKLDRQRRKVGVEAWDRNYMQSPGRSTTGRGTFNKTSVEPCKRADMSLLHQPAAGAVCYVGLDPAIDSHNCVMVTEATPDYKLIVRRIQDVLGLKNNAQIIGQCSEAIDWTRTRGALCTDLVIEAMAFQKGLLHDENLIDLRKRTGIQVRDHLTGWNKYDPDIGIPSMVESFNRQEILLPWGEDAYTREQVGELVRQLYTWKPGKRGKVLRQDMVMALWFCWITWRERWKKPAKQRGPKGFTVRGLPYAPTRTGLLVPTR